MHILSSFNFWPALKDSPTVRSHVRYCIKLWFHSLIMSARTNNLQYLKKHCFHLSHHTYIIMGAAISDICHASLVCIYHTSQDFLQRE